jgi:hypothetical protein
MSELRALKQQILQEGVDLQIDQADWDRIRELLPTHANPSDTDLRILMEIRTEARSVCSAFDEYFFPALKEAILADGKVSMEEHFQLLRMLYGGGGIDDRERKFLQELRRDLPEVTPEFETLYKQAMQD